MKTQMGQTSIEVVVDKTALEMITDITNQADCEDPFFVVDLSDIVYRYKLWKLKMPRVQPFYAVKCNDCPIILELLAALGIGFDCASRAEIEAVLDKGVDPSRIIYANPCKTKSFIKHAESVEVDLMTFDNETELYKVKAIHPSARMVIRIRADDASAICCLGMKFGCNLGEVPHLLNVAKELGVNVVGASFHVGSGCQDPTSFAKAISAARHVFDIGEELGFDFNLLDIGGGYPGARSSQVFFEEMTTVINEALDLHFPPDSGIQIIAEPGRFFVTSAFTLCTNIIAKREVSIADGSCAEEAMMYYLNDGVYGSFNCLIFDHAQPTPIPLLEMADRPVLRSSLWGPTCDGMDRVMENCYLPAMEVGEWIVFENMGAYTMSAASTFNGFQKPLLKFLLPLPTWAYLQQLPTYIRLVNALGFHQSDTGQSNGNGLGSDDGFRGLPVSEPVSA